MKLKELKELALTAQKSEGPSITNNPWHDFMNAVENPHTVLELIERIEGLSEVLQCYGDREEWKDYKAVCEDGTEVDSHSNIDEGIWARDALAKFGPEAE